MADNPLVLDLIQAACLAGANRTAARQGTYGRGGFEKLANKHSRRVEECAARVCRQAASEGGNDEPNDPDAVS